MTAFLLLAAIVLGLWFFVFRAETRDELRYLFSKASMVVRKEMKEREK